jgi:hypothetical protein
MNQQTIKRLKSLGACNEAVKWCSDQPNAQAAWDACEHPDWMVWLLAKTAGEPGSAAHRRVVLLCCDLAATALQYVPQSEKRPAAAIRLARRWARGDATVTMEVLRLAADAAYTAAYAADAAYTAADADAYAAYTAAYAAAYAAYTAADAAADAASYAADAADAAAAAAAAAAADAAAYQRTRVRLAGMIRRRYPKPPRI